MKPLAEKLGIGPLQRHTQVKINTADALVGMTLAMLGPMVSGWAAYECGRIGNEMGQRKKKMESNRMKRTADARAMSKKNLVFAFVELGRQYDEATNVVASLRNELDASRIAARINGEEMTKRRDVLPKLDRAYEEIRRMRTLLAHYLESEVGS